MPRRPPASGASPSASPALPPSRTSTTTAWRSCSAARDTRITTDPRVRFNVRVLAGPPPGLPPDLHPLVPLLIAVEGLDPDLASTIITESDPAFDAKARKTRKPEKTAERE